jgi:hypothetical protein
MPYIIAFVIIIVAAGALLLFRQPAEVPVSMVEEIPGEPVEQANNFPEGFTPPTEPPPTMNPGGEAAATEPTAEINGGAAAAGPAAEIDSAPAATADAAAATTQQFVAEASYLTPRRTEHNMVITLKLDGETITDASITYDGSSAATPMHLAFDGAYQSEIIGQNINNVELSRVGGASLTSVAFNEGVAEIRAQL